MYHNAESAEISFSRLVTGGKKANFRKSVNCKNNNNYKIIFKINFFTYCSTNMFKTYLCILLSKIKNFLVCITLRPLSCDMNLGYGSCSFTDRSFLNHFKLLVYYVPVTPGINQMGRV